MTCGWGMGGFGGTGRISSACAEVAVARGIDLTILNRGQISLRGVPDGVRALTADIRDKTAARAVLADREFDAVVDFIAYNPEHVGTDIELFSGRTGQYVFISSASAYQKPVAMLPIQESTPLRNPYWAYARAKIASEERLAAEYREHGFPVTIIRPSHTYDRTSIPLLGGWTAIDRMRRGEPVVVHGDGTSLWVLTHHADFARAFVPLLGRPQAIGDTFHITGDEAQPWNQIYLTLGRAAGAEPELVHVSSEQIARTVPDWGPALLGDASHSVIFDNTKVRQLVPGCHATIPWAEGAREIIEWFDADPARRVVDPAAEANIKSLTALGSQAPPSVPYKFFPLFRTGGGASFGLSAPFPCSESLVGADCWRQHLADRLDHTPSADTTTACATCGTRAVKSVTSQSRSRRCVAGLGPLSRRRWFPASLLRPAAIRPRSGLGCRQMAVGATVAVVRRGLSCREQLIVAQLHTVSTSSSRSWHDCCVH